MRDRFSIKKELLPLTRAQRETLLRRTLSRILPDNLQLTDAGIQEVMELLPGGSIRQLDCLGDMIINCARDGEKRVPPTKKHVLQALALLRGSARSATTPAANPTLASPDGSSSDEATDSEDARTAPDALLQPPQQHSPSLGHPRRLGAGAARPQHVSVEEGQLTHALACALGAVPQLAEKRRARPRPRP